MCEPNPSVHTIQNSPTCQNPKPEGQMPRRLQMPSGGPKRFQNLTASQMLLHCRTQHLAHVLDSVVVRQLGLSILLQMCMLAESWRHRWSLHCCQLSGCHNAHCCCQDIMIDLVLSSQSQCSQASSTCLDTQIQTLLSASAP